MSDNFLDDDDFDGRQFAPPAPRPDLDDPRVGFFPDMAVEDYFADPIEEGSLSQSGIKILLDESPLDFRVSIAAPQSRRDRESRQERGHAARRPRSPARARQGPRLRDRRFCRLARRKAAQDFKKAAEADGLCPALRSKFEEAEVMAEVIVERVKRILDGASYVTEVPIVWREDTPAGDIYCRGMLDIWCEELATIVDPKVTDSLGNGRPGAEKIERHAVNMGWDLQAGFYTRGVERLLPALDGRVRFGNLMVKPEAPFTSRLLWPSITAKRTAIYQARPAMLLFAKCQRDGLWPAYPEEGETLELPSFEENRRLEAEISAHG
jgi:hypothetical protein